MECLLRRIAELVLKRLLNVSVIIIVSILASFNLYMIPSGNFNCTIFFNDLLQDSNENLFRSDFQGKFYHLSTFV